MLAPPLEPADAVHVRARGRRLLYFGGCDYFRLSLHPGIARAMVRGLARWGLNVAASRRTTGNRDVYEALERELAGFFRAEAAVLVSTGYVTDLVAAQALAGGFSHALIDDRAHAALIDAAAALDCPVVAFQHRSPADLEHQLRRLGRRIRPVVLTDGLFAHDGAVAPLREYLRILPRDAVVLVDDAHGAGVLGPHGRGALEWAGVDSGRIVRTLTLSKAFGTYGGAILGSRALRDRIRTRSRLFIGNTPLPPPLASAARAALRRIKAGAGLRRRLHANAGWLKDTLRRAGVAIPDYPGPILALYPRGPRGRAGVDRRLLRAGILPPFLDYGGQPAGGYYRFAVSSAHRRPQLRALATALLACRPSWSAEPPAAAASQLPPLQPVPRVRAG